MTKWDHIKAQALSACLPPLIGFGFAVSTRFIHRDVPSFPALGFVGGVGVAFACWCAGFMFAEGQAVSKGEPQDIVLRVTQNREADQ